MNVIPANLAIASASRNPGYCRGGFETRSYPIPAGRSEGIDDGWGADFSKF